MNLIGVIPKRASSLRRSFGWPDLVVLLALVGLLAILAWLGHGMWVPLRPGALPTLDLSPRNLPYYAGRSLLRMFIALGASLLFTFVVASWAAKSRRVARVILPALDILQSVPVLLEKHFSREEARRQLETAIQWGRYAELFGFEDDTDELFLETSELHPA